MFAMGYLPLKGTADYIRLLLLSFNPLGSGILALELIKLACDWSAFIKALYLLPTAPARDEVISVVALSPY